MEHLISQMVNPSNLLIRKRDLSLISFSVVPLSFFACLIYATSSLINDIIKFFSASGKNDNDLNQGSRKHTLFKTSTFGSW